MGVVIEDIRIKPTDFVNNTVETDYLLGNVGDKVTIEVDFRAEEIFVSSGEADVDRILVNVSPHLVNTPDQKDIIYCELDGVFDNYRVGDTIKFYDVVGMSFGPQRIVYEKGAKFIRVMNSIPGDVDFTGLSQNYSLGIDSYIWINTDLTSIKYRWNFVSNSESSEYLDKIANQLNQVKAGGVDNTDTVTVVPMIFDAPVTNDIGTITVKGNGSLLTSGEEIGQKFTLTHETIITPFFLPGQQFDLEDNIPPSYFDGAECLKYIVEIDVGRNDNDPNYIQTEDFTANDGNTGWFGENFNGNANNYSISDVRYIRQDLSSIDAIELTDNTQTVEIDVYSNNGTFSNNNTEFTLNFCILPEEKDDVRYNGKTISQNFFFDYAKNVVGSAAVAGDNNGTDYEVFNQVSAAYVDANNITITAEIDFTAAGVTDLTDRDFEYFLWVSVADHTKETEETDRVSLKADIRPFYIDLTDDGMVTQTTKFLRHYESDFDTEGTTDLIARTEDDILGYTQFYFDITGRASDAITLENIKVSLVARKPDGTYFELESYSQDTNGYPILADGFPYIAKDEARVFQMPDGDQRKTISINRRTDLDTAFNIYYDIKYPFLFRWEYWVALAGADTETFDPTKENNGLNENWHRYDTITDWDIFYRTEIRATKNNQSLLYRNDTQMTTFTYEEDSDWTTETIQALDADTLADIGVLKSPCRIKASKTYVGGTPPALDDVEWVLRIEVYEQGGISDIRYLSSVYDWTEKSWFNSVDASNKVFKSINGSIYSAEALIDFSSLPDDTSFKVSARIYNEAALAPIPEGAKLMEDGTVKLMEDGTTKIIE